MQNEYLDLLKLTIAVDELEKTMRRPGCRLSVEDYKGKLFVYAVWKEDKREKREYLGKYSPIFEEAIALHSRHGAIQKEKRRLLNDFRKRGFPQVDTQAGQIIDSLAQNGFFRLRGMLIGTNAFIQYPAMFGDLECFETGKKINTMRTGDVDFAMFQSISLKLAATDQRMTESFENTLQKTGDYMPQYDSRGFFSGRWIAKDGFEVDLLTPFRREASLNRSKIDIDYLHELPIAVPT